MAVTVRTCENCAYRISDGDESTCHLNPPTALPKYNQNGYTARWPKLDELTGWCGQWAAEFLIQNKPGPVV